MGAIGTAIGYRIGKSYAGRAGAKAKNVAEEVLTHPETSKALSNLSSKGGTVGKAAGYVASNPDKVADYARQAGAYAAPMIGAHIGNQVGNRADQTVGRVANMVVGATRDGQYQQNSIY